MNLADGKISKRQWFRMSYLECVTISMMMIPYITLSLAGKYHVLALVVGLAFVVFYGALMFFLADFVPCGYINAIRNHMGWTAGILDVLYALRYLLRATLIAVFFSMILQRYLLQSFSVWWIFLPFLGITLYGASKSMEGRGRMFEFLFGWMVVPLILIVVFSVSNIDIGAIMQGITSQSEVSGVFKGAYAILLALSPLELQLYSRPCVKEKDRMGGIWLLVWILFTIVFSYLFIVAILGYGWTASDTTASFNVMEAASFPGGAVARLDYPVMAFWIIGVFAVVSGYLHQTRDFLYSLCEVKQKSGRVVTFVVMFAGACLFAYGMQFESAVKYGMRYFLYADLAIGIVFPLIVMWVKTEKRVKWGIGFVCLTVLAAVGSVWIGNEKLGRQFIQNDFTASEQKKETLEYRDYVLEMQVETAKDGYQFTFVIADIAGYEGENSIKQILYHVQADSLEMAAELYRRENERQLDFGHMKQIAADMTGEEMHRLLLELGHRPGISKSVPVMMESDGAKYILREMIKAAYGRESL